MDLVLHPSTASLPRNPKASPLLRADGQVRAAEFRGPGIRNQFEDNPEEYDMDADRTRGYSARAGRIILLGDGTEVIPDQNEEELFDQTEEDQDLTNQVQHETGTRDREATPGPQGKQETGTAQISESPASTDAEKEKSAS